MLQRFIKGGAHYRKKIKGGAVFSRWTPKSPVPHLSIHSRVSVSVSVPGVPSPKWIQPIHKSLWRSLLTFECTTTAQLRDLPAPKLPLLASILKPTFSPKTSSSNHKPMSQPGFIVPTWPPKTRSFLYLSTSMVGPFASLQPQIPFTITPSTTSYPRLTLLLSLLIIG